MPNPLSQLQPVTVNPFDQFDEPQQTTSLNPALAHAYGANAQVQQPQSVQANPFDQFDTHQPDGALAAGARGVASGATFNLADPMVAGLQAAFGDLHPTSDADTLAARYHENLAALRGVAAADREAHPVASFAGEVAGSIANPANRLLGPVNSIGSAARVGGRLGLGYGFGAGVTNDQGVADTVEEAGKGALTGGLTAGVLKGLGGAVAQHLLQRPTVDLPGIERAAHAAYDAADNSGAWIKQSSMQKMAADLDPILAQAGMAPGLHDNAILARGLIGQAAQGNMTWKGLGILDKQVSGLIGKAVRVSPDDARVTHLVKDNLENFVNRLGDRDVVPGTGSGVDVQAAVGSMKQAKALWRAKSQAEFVGNLMDAADLRSNGLTVQAQQNAVRGRFMTAALNKNQMRRLSPDLQTAIRAVAKGNPGISALRLLGKFAPQGLHSISMGGMGVGYTLGGPLGAAAVMGAGEAGKRGAQFLTNRAADNAMVVAGRLPAGVSVQRGLNSLPRLKVMAARGALQLPRLTPALVPLAVGGGN